LAHVIRDDAIDGQVLNIGNPDEISVRKLAQRIADLTSTTASIALGPRRVQDPVRRRPVITKMMVRYGWRPRVTLDEGLRRTIDWFAAPYSPAPISPARRRSASRDLVSTKGA
jgi:nucleoside-diphosphate-sugar epimerase